MATKPVEFTKTVSASGTPEQVTTTQSSFHSAIIIGKNAARTDNTGTVYLGITAANDSQFIEVAPGETLALNAPANMLFDWQDFYLDVDTNDDGIYVFYR